MLKLQLQEIDGNDYGKTMLAYVHTLYTLANIMEQEGFVYCTAKFQALITNLQSMIICSVQGDKEIFYKIKKSVESGLKDFIETHIKIVEAEYKKKIKGKN